MWKLLPLIYRAFKTDAYDYLEEMLPSLENYLHFGAKHFIGDRESQMCIIDIAQSILAGTECGEADYVRGCQLLQTFLLNLQGQLDEVCADTRASSSRFPYSLSRRSCSWPWASSLGTLSSRPGRSKSIVPR